MTKEEKIFPPLQAKSMVELQSQFPLAVHRIFTDDDVLTNHRPASHPENIFDYKGWRLIVSRDAIDGNKPFIHLSVSAQKHAIFELFPGETQQQLAANKADTIKRYQTYATAHVLKLIMEITQQNVNLFFLAMSSDLVMHFEIVDYVMPHEEN